MSFLCSSRPTGKHGIICLEDLIHEIYSVGKNFRAANNFLLPFRLSVARHSIKDKAGLLKDLGNPGYRGTDINVIIRQLNWGGARAGWTLGWTSVSETLYLLRNSCHFFGREGLITRSVEALALSYMNYVKILKLTHTLRFLRFSEEQSILATYARLLMKWSRRAVLHAEASSPPAINSYGVCNLQCQ